MKIPKLFPIFVKKILPSTDEGRILTQCFLVDENKKIIAYGQSVQNPIDNFNRKLGNRIAFNRASYAASLISEGITETVRTCLHTSTPHWAIRTAGLANFYEHDDYLVNLLNRIDITKRKELVWDEKTHRYQLQN